MSPGTAVTLTATVVSAGTPVTPGTVTFCDLNFAKTCAGLAVIGTAQLTAAGKASIVIRLGAGSHSLEAVFAGTNSLASSESAPDELTVSGTLTRGTQLSFSNSATPAVTGLQPGAVAVGDFNNDGNLDMAVANATDLNQPVVDTTKDVVAVFLGKGDGTFQAGVSYHVGAVPLGLLAADLNNDGKLDLVTVNHLDGTVSVLLGNGDGSFQTDQAIPVMPQYMSLNAITVADMNGDGNLDLLVASYGAGSTGVDILLGNGDGTFQAPKDSITNPGLPVSPTSLTTADFNGDGKLDVAVAGWQGEGQDTILVLLGNGDGTLGTANFVDQGIIRQSATSIVAGDFNGDGKLDLATTNFPFTAGLNPGSYSILLGNGDGTFQNPITYFLPGTSVGTSIQTADFNGDGKLDLAMLGAGAMIFLGNGDGTFQAPQSFPFAESTQEESDQVVGDFNGDGLLDLAGPAVFLNTSASVVASSFTVTVSPSSLTLASGKQGTVMVTVTPKGGLGTAVSFACSGLPAGASCTFNPMSVTPSGAAASTTLTITAQTLTSMLPSRSAPLFPKLIPVLVLSILWPRKWRRRFMLLLVIGLAGLSFLSACGGSGSHHSGSSTVTVTATSGSIKQSVTISLSVN